MVAPVRWVGQAGFAGCSRRWKEVAPAKLKRIFPFGSVMAVVADAVAPDFVVKGFRDGIVCDMIFYAIVPAAWYKAFRKRHPKTCAEAFAECAEMK